MFESKRNAIFIVLFLQLSPILNSAPLSTHSRWIIDQATGKRAKLHCLNWASHLPTMIAEGLEKKPLKHIVRQFVEGGFNCARFSWATYMFTRSEYYELTVSQSLERYQLTAAKAGVAKNNEWILGLKIREAHRAVVDELGRQNLMVVLDNTISEPMWCCAGNDGNGFFKDEDFDPTEWLQGLSEVAKWYKDNAAVVGMSIRNELRGSRQNLPDYYKFMQKGANEVHQQNPNLLVIISGLKSDRNLSFLRNNPLKLNHDNKWVFEAHLYSFGISSRMWTERTNSLCNTITQLARTNFLFLTGDPNPFPLFLSEFGIDQSGENEADNRYISCLLAEMAGTDVDWALWALQGSYMMRQGKVDYNETYGVMDFEWDHPRNPSFLRRLRLLKHINQDPNSMKPTTYIMLHPLTGKCARLGKANHILLDNCNRASRWEEHKNGGQIKMAGGSQGCLVANREGGAAFVSKDCSSGWRLGSSSSLHLAFEKGKGEYLCLEKKAYGPKIVTKKCMCVDDNLVDHPTCLDNPQIQWFKFVPTNV